MSNATDARRFCVKVFAAADDAAEINLEPFIGLFHRWIQQGVLDELMVDVADYRHVPQGPGVMLICHGTHYALDSAEGRLGLLCSAKRAEPDALGARIRQVMVRALKAARMLEQQQDAPLRFDGARLLLQVQDRLLAPNDDATLTALREPLQRVADALYPGGSPTLRRVSDDSRGPFAVAIESSLSDGPTLATLLERAEQLPAQ